MTTKSIGFDYFICGGTTGGWLYYQAGEKKATVSIFAAWTEDFEWANHCYEQLKNYIPLNPQPIEK